MRRIFPDYTYGPGPRAGCWWDETCTIPVQPALTGSVRCDVAIVGAGFTGLSAALHLAEQGVDVVVVEAERVGWGASGRNGGFCCLGGGMLNDSELDRYYGKAARLEWRRVERQAIDVVDGLIHRLDLDVDRHSIGETRLAHRASDARVIAQDASTVSENYGVDPDVMDQAELIRQGMAGPFFAGMTIPIGFGLNPRKYLAGLLEAALAAGVRVFERSAVLKTEKTDVRCADGRVASDTLVFATNGYSSENVPEELAARYMPAQSNVLVTRPLTEAECAAQGWTSSQMAYDSRNLLHYFRLMPDRRFLFGMRGGLLSSPKAEAAARRTVLRDFRAMFPDWSDVQVTHAWSGLVCLNRNRMPFVGPIGSTPGVLAGFAYHGNGVAMGTLAGQILADLAMGRVPPVSPKLFRATPERFPFGAYRRMIMPPIYAAMGLADRMP